MYVSAISADGTQLLGSTFLGGENNEGFNDSLRFNYGDSFRGEVEVQRGGGPVYLVATADSSGYPITLVLQITKADWTAYFLYSAETWTRFLQYLCGHRRGRGLVQLVVNF